MKTAERLREAADAIRTEQVVEVNLGHIDEREYPFGLGILSAFVGSFAAILIAAHLANKRGPEDEPTPPRYITHLEAHLLAQIEASLDADTDLQQAVKDFERGGQS